MNTNMDMNEEKTFELEELDEAFWKKVVYAEIWPSSGMGGPGCIWLVTEEKKLYHIGFNGFPYEGKLGKFNPLFAMEKSDDGDGRYYKYVAEKDGWKYSKKGRALVREDLFEAYEAAWDAVYDLNVARIHYVFGVNVIGIALGAEGEMERWDYIVSAKKYWEEREFYRKLEEENARKKLTDDYFLWKPRYVNNIYSESSCEGYYCLLLKEHEETISGVRFTIAYQREELSPLCRDGFDAPIQEYLLFEKSYDDIRGALEYRDPKGESDSMQSMLYLGFWDTLNDCELNDCGEFVRAFSSIEEAKKYAVEVNAFRHHVDKENIIRDIQDSKIRRIQYKNRIREYDAILLFGKRYREIMKILSEYEFPSESSGGGGYIIRELEEKLGMDTELIQEMMPYIPRILLPRYQRKAAELLTTLEAEDIPKLDTKKANKKNP